MVVKKKNFVAAIILFASAGVIAFSSDQGVYLSLYYLDPATSKTYHDMVLLTDGRTISIERGKIRAPKIYIRTRWNEFNKESAVPPESGIRLRFEAVKNKANVCLNDSCAIVHIVCPPIQDMKSGAKCLTVPSLPDLNKVK